MATTQSNERASKGSALTSPRTTLPMRAPGASTRRAARDSMAGLQVEPHVADASGQQGAGQVRRSAADLKHGAPGEIGDQGLLRGVPADEAGRSGEYAGATAVHQRSETRSAAPGACGVIGPGQRSRAGARRRAAPDQARPVRARSGAAQRAPDVTAPPGQSGRSARSVACSASISAHSGSMSR